MVLLAEVSIGSEYTDRIIDLPTLIGIVILVYLLCRTFKKQ